MVRFIYTVGQTTEYKNYFTILISGFEKRPKEFFTLEQIYETYFIRKKHHRVMCATSKQLERNDEVRNMSQYQVNNKIKICDVYTTL